MLKKKVVPIADPASRSKCGECLHFKRQAKFEKPCSQLGVKHFAVAPTCYSPDPYILAKIAPDVIMRLGLLLKDMSGKESRVFLNIVKKIPHLEKNFNLRLGQPVYFRLGSDYLSNYFRGYVLMCSSAGDSEVYITSDLNKKQRKEPVIATLLRDSVFTVTEWKKKKAKLEKDKKLQDPNPLFNTKVDKTKLEADGYVPPSLETAPAEWFDKVEKRNKRPKAKNSIKKEADGTLTFTMKGKSRK